ncbi:S8 family peptidase [Candidatus Poribacteria bacterium]
MKRTFVIACAMMLVLALGSGVVHAKGKPPKDPPPDDPPPEPTVELLPWGVDRIDADMVWETTTGAGIKVAILDTGIDKNHPDLAANIKGGVNTLGTNVPNDEFDDQDGHGTRIAGVIGAVDNTEGVIGIGPGIDLYAVRFRKNLPMLTDDNGERPELYAGMRWCIDNNMQVISMSFTVWSVKWVKRKPQPDKPEHDSIFYALIQEAYEKGIVLVAAMGNDSVQVDDYDPADYQQFDENYRFPASYPEVIGVSSIDDEDSFASYSNYGTAVDLAAPGVSVETTTIDGYGTFGGTSAACPHVAATAALVLKQLGATAPQPGLPDQVRTILTGTAEWLSGLTSDQQGEGLVDAEAAVSSSSSAPALYTLSPRGKLSVTWGELKNR